MVVVESSGKGVEEVREGRRGVCVFVCSVRKERTRPGEVEAGREEGEGGGRVGERQREVKEVGWRERSNAGRE